MHNAIQPKPVYTVHRKVTGSPVAADNSNLQTLYQVPGNSRAAINCAGWKTVRGFVALEGGTSPTVDLVPLEKVEAEGGFPGATDEDAGFAVVGAAIASLADKETFSFPIHGGLLYLRIDAVSGAPTDVRVYLAGEEREEHTRGGV